jgi:hypothetical protein
MGLEILARLKQKKIRRCSSNFLFWSRKEIFALPVRKKGFSP